jgi:hypothetical protein
MNRRIIILSAFLCWVFSIKAQVAQPCPNPAPPGANSCQNACVYCNIDGITGVNNGPPGGMDPICNGQITIHNDAYFGFVAGSTSITFNIATSGCVTGDGLQTAIFENCSSDAVACNPGVPNGAGQPLTVSYDQFVPGQTYYLMVDGYIADVCNFTIEVLSGSVAAPPAGAPMQPQGLTHVCPGATVVYHIDDVPNAGYYQWTGPTGSHINGGTNNVTLPAPGGTTVTVTFGTAGGTLCVKAGNVCTSPQTACITIVNQPIAPTIKPKKIICFESLPYTWDEAPNTIISLPGDYLLTSTPYTSYLGCDSTVKQSVKVLNQIKTNLNTVFICEGTCFSINGHDYCTTGGPFQETFQSFRGCDSVVQFSVYLIPDHANIPAVAGIDCADPNVTLLSTGSSAGPGVTYKWTNSTWNTLGTGTSLTVNSGGIFYLIVANTGGSGTTCRDTAQINVNANLTPPGASATGGNLNCLAALVTLHGSSPTNGVTFQWAGPGITPANQNLQNPVVDVSGNYVLVVTNPVNSCTSIATITVNADQTPPTAAVVTGTINCVQPVLTLHAATDATSAGFNWTGPGIYAGNQTVQDPMIIVEGVYVVTITNTINGCSATAEGTVLLDKKQPVADAGADQIITCLQSQVTLAGSGNAGGALIVFGWSGPGINASNQTLPLATVDTAGLYILTITNAQNGCAAKDTVLVNADVDPPMANAGPDKVITCAHPAIQLEGGISMGATIAALWTGPGITVANQSQFTPQVNLPGTYVIALTNTTNGCMASDTVLVSLNKAAPVADAGSDQTLTCTQLNGLTLQGNGQPATVTFFWSGPGIGVNNDTLQNPVVSQAGTYSLEVTDPVNGCTATDETIVILDAGVPTANAGPDQTLNCAVHDVNLITAGTSVGPVFSYLWTGPGVIPANATSLSQPPISQPGVYTLAVTNTSNNCVNSDIVIIQIDTLKPSVSAGPDLVLNCFNKHVDTLAATVSDAGPNAFYFWTGPDITPVNQHALQPVIHVAGLYSLTVTNFDNSCTASSVAMVTEDITPPVADAGMNQTIDCVISSIAIGGNSSAGFSFQYLWTGPGILPGDSVVIKPVVSAAGQYNLLVTNTNNGCTGSDTVTVFSTAVYPVANAGSDTTLTCAIPSIDLDGTSSTTGPFFQATWTGPDIAPSSQHQIAPAVGLPGLYILTITNTSNSCATSDTVLVKANQQPPVIQAPANLSLDCQTQQVVLDGSKSATGANIAYLWAGPGITPANATVVDPAVSLPGTYQFLVTNLINGCTSTLQTIVSQDITPPVANAGNDVVLTCSSPAQILDGSNSSVGAVYTYVWTGPGINTNNFNQQQPVVTEPGTYTLIVTSSVNHCMAVDLVVAGQDIALPVVKAGPDQVLTCSNDTLQLDGSGSQTGVNITYAWSGPGILPGAATQQSPQVNKPGIYTLVVMNSSNGCTNTDAAEVTENKFPPFADAGLGQTLNCSNAATGVTLDASSSSTGAGFTILWTGPGITTANQHDVHPVVLVDGQYNLLITNSTNGCTATDQVLIQKDEILPIANAGADQTVDCAILQATIDGSGSSAGNGALQYFWTGPGIDIGNQHDPAPVVTLPGLYILTATNLNNGCTAVDSVQVKQDILPPVFKITTDTITCAKPLGTIAVQATPGFQYAWIGPDINPGNASLATFQVSVPGQYNVTVTGLNGCTAVAGVTVAASVDFPDGKAEGALLDCKNNGTAMLNGQINTPGATFIWLGPNGNPFSNVLDPVVTQPGTYTLVITAPNGCERSIALTVETDYTKPLVHAEVKSLLDCTTNTLSINTSGTSTGPVYSYHWTTPDGNILSGADGLSPVVNKPGSYQLVVINNLNGCKDSTSVLVQNDPSVPTALDLAIKDISCYGYHDGVISILKVTGGTEPFLFSLNGGDHSQLAEFSGLIAGSYVIALEDSHGCRLDTTVIVQEPGPLILELGQDKHVQLGEDVTIKAHLDYTTPLAAVIWNYAPDCDTTMGKECLEFTYKPLQSTRHIVTVIDSNGCTATDAVNVLVNKKRLVYVPNVFSPGSDDPLNAILMIQGGLGIQIVHSWLIFDRWGNPVFEARNFQPNQPASAWDGLIRGEKAQPGVYAWFAEIEFIDGEVEIFKGDATLIR